ncbi:MAG: hypothetical protein V9G12_12055 [Microthrixaceae bacterium]
MESVKDLTPAFRQARVLPLVSHEDCLALAEAIASRDRLSYSIGKDTEEDWVIINRLDEIGPRLGMAICKIRPLILNVQCPPYSEFSRFVVVNFDSPMSPVRVQREIFLLDFKFQESLDSQRI